MKYFIVLLFLLSVGMVEAKVLQGDGLHGGAVNENFVKQGDAEVVLSGIRAYNDGDVAEPTTCTGTLTGNGIAYAREATTEMGGNYSWKITKAAGSQRGKGIAFDFAIDKFSSREKISQELSARVSSLSGVFASGTNSDVKLFLIAKDSGAKVMLRGGNDILGPQVKLWFTPNGVNYSLCLHVATTTASNFTLNVKNVRVTEAGSESRGDVNNTFTARVAGTASPSTVSLRTGPYREWVNNCTRPETGKWECPVVGFNQKLSCITGRVASSATVDPYTPTYLESESTNQKVVFFSKNPGSSLFNMDFTISCTRTGSDYIKDAVIADQYTGVDVGLYARGNGTATALVADVQSTIWTTVPYPVIKKGFSSMYSNGVWTAPRSGYFCTKASAHFERVSGTAPAAGSQVFRLNLNISGGQIFEKAGFSLGTTYSADMLSVEGCADLVKDQTIRVQVLKETGITSVWRITNWDAPNNFVVWESSNTATAFRPDTFYPADVVNTETQVGWDRTVTPIKPIYKRCHVVASDISTGGTIATWPTNLHPVEHIKYSSTQYLISIMAGFGTVDGVRVDYIPSTGVINLALAGSGRMLGAGTKLCMTYTKP